GGSDGGAFPGVTARLGGAGWLVGGTVKTGAQTAAPWRAQYSNQLDGMEKWVRQRAAGQDPQALRDAAASAVRGLLSGDPAQKAQAGNRAADALAKAQGIPTDQAKTQIQDYEKQYDAAVADAKQKAKVAAEAA
ncbi:PhnA-like protein, partial [Methylobacterium sp. E-041]|nr:PhnA-like protein [Methylobacterium sp. E-041]